MLLIPKNFKYKKKQKGKKTLSKIKVKTLKKMNFKTIKLKANKCGKISSKQLVTIKQLITKAIKKKGKLQVTIFPNIQTTKKPSETRMGKGKGNVEQ
jgi:large subunit ribosomal protein L16